MAKKLYYLAYGSNLNVRQMRYRCPGAKPIGISVIPDYELLYKGSKTGVYLTIEPKKNSIVPVAVWEVTADDEKRLDAFIYIMHEERKHGIPSLTYIRTCEEGYRNFGFDTKFLDAAYEISAKEVQR